jgi:hypothetical protein
VKHGQRAGSAHQPREAGAHHVLQLARGGQLVLPPDKAEAVPQLEDEVAQPVDQLVFERDP